MSNEEIQEVLDELQLVRPDGSIQAVHCGWISTIPDDWGENKLLKEGDNNGVSNI